MTEDGFLDLGEGMPNRVRYGRRMTERRASTPAIFEHARMPQERIMEQRDENL